MPHVHSHSHAHILAATFTWYTWDHAGNNLTGIAVQFATQAQKNATQVKKCIAILWHEKLVKM